MRVQILSFFLLLSVQGLNVWPKPNKFTQGQEEVSFHICNLRQIFNENNESNFPEIFQQRLEVKLKDFPKESLEICSYVKMMFRPTIILKIADISYTSPTADMSEKYQIEIDNLQIKISADTYLGYSRAIETLFQLLESKKGESSIRVLNCPIKIEDEPYVKYRGVMIDTARHYLKVSTILRTIEGMGMNKLNALHWHISDDESFPLQLKTLPNITKYGAFDSQSIYTAQDVETIINHGNLYGVRIIPEIDSPGHVRAMGLAQEYIDKNMTLQNCPGGEGYNAQLDPTLDIGYEVVEQIWDDVNNMFVDDLIHMGGDEVSGKCWETRPSIKEYMAKHNISDYEQMQLFFRAKTRQAVKQQKTAIYWADENIDLPPIQQQDILQYWGQYENIPKVLNKVNNRVILSPEDFTYLNTGINFIWGNNFGTFISWAKAYDYEPYPEGIDKKRVYGGEACLWGEVNDDQSIDMYLWPRASALAERMWTQEKAQPLDAATRLIQFRAQMVERGFNAAPLTCELCERKPEICFKNSLHSQKKNQ